MRGQIAHWNPWQELEALGRQIDRAFGQFPLRAVEAREGQDAPVQGLRADVLESPDAWVLRFDLPGVDRNNIEVEVGKGVLTVKAERQFSEASEGENYHRVERFHGRYARSFALPEDADGESVEAGYEDGVLTVRVGRRAESKPRTVKVA